MTMEMEESFTDNINQNRKDINYSVSLLRYLAYSMLGLYLYLLFFQKDCDPKNISLLNIYALLL